MPNSNESEYRQLPLNFAWRPAALPSPTGDSENGAGGAPTRGKMTLAGGSVRYSPYLSPRASQEESRTCKDVITGIKSSSRSSMALKKSESGSKMVIDLTGLEVVSASAPPPQAQKRPQVPTFVNSHTGLGAPPTLASVDLSKFRFAAPTATRGTKAAASRSSGWSQPPPLTVSKPTTAAMASQRSSGWAQSAASKSAAVRTLEGAQPSSLPSKSTKLTDLIGARNTAGASGHQGKAAHRQLPWEPKTEKTSLKRVPSRSMEEGGSSGNRQALAANKEKWKPVELSAEQEHVATLVTAQRQSLFFTGSAGTGKSVLLREIIRRLRETYKKQEIAVTASTGIAACNINGTTLHSFSGCGLGQEPAEILAGRVQRNPRTAKRWAQTKVLIIDEISMVEGDFFDKLEYVAQKVRKDSSPFGGIQLVICGDFMQLPPVSRKASFAFEAKSWSRCIKKTVQLKHVFRQKDSTLINLLNEMRIGIVSPESERILMGLSRELAFGDGLEPTSLFAVRTQVDDANTVRLRNLNGSSRTFDATDYTRSDADKARLKDFMAPQTLELKIGAQVMLIKNIDDKLVNGSLGKVHGFEKESGNPIVDFTVSGGRESRLMEMATETWSCEMPGLGVVASRTQIPLLLAYSMSIHKSQGQTLERVKVDLGRVFENGQAYVALSRATSLEGLQVLNYKRDKVRVDPRVIEFNKNLSHYAG